MPDWSRFADLLPQGQMPIFGVRVMTSLKEDGSLDVAWVTDQDDDTVRLYEAIGVLESVQFEMYHSMLHEEED